MKTREGFVSNSSTTTFVCDICSNSEGGMDCSAAEVGFARCINEHEFCEAHLIGAAQKTPPEDMLAFIKTLDSRFYQKTIDQAQQHYDNKRFDHLEDMYRDYREGRVDSSRCPVCNFQSPLIRPFCKWLLKQLQWSEGDALAKLKAEYNGDIKRFQEDFKQ
jgi:hypothetical protein